MWVYSSLAATLLCVALSTAEDVVRYDGYQVIETLPLNKNHLELLQGLTSIEEVIQGNSGSRVNHPFSFAVGPNFAEFVKFQLRAHKIDYDVVYEDIQVLIDQQIRDNNLRKLQKQATNFQTFNDLETIENQLEEWSNNCPPGLSCELRSVGQSFEGRDIYNFKVGPAAGAQRAVFIDSTIHAREWISTSTLFRSLDHMINSYGTDPTVTRLLNTYDFYTVVVYNPDGYSFTWTNARLWRKNRQPLTECVGTDLNRNFAYRWAEEGAEPDNECNDLYPGPAPHSELETQHVTEDILDIQSRQDIIAYVNLHSFGRMWMFPWGNTINNDGVNCERSDDYDDLMQVAEATADAIQETWDSNWDRGTSCEVIYAATGAADDWNKAIAGVKYAFNPELRGPFFIIGEQNIEPAFQETWNGIVAMIEEIEKIENY